MSKTVGDRHVEVAGLAAIELEPELGNADRKRREQARKLGAFAGLGHEPVGNVGQRLHAPSFAILDQELEAAGGAQPLNRRRREDQGDGVLNIGGKCLLEPANQGPGPQFGSLALLPGLEHHIDGAAVGLIDLRERIQAVEPNRVGDAFGLERNLLDAIHDPGGRLLGGSVGGLDGDDEIALVLHGTNDLGRSTSIQAVSASSASEGMTTVHQWWAVNSRNESYEFSSHDIPRLNQRKKKNCDSP